MKIKYIVVPMLLFSLCGCSVVRKTKKTVEDALLIGKTAFMVHKTAKSLIGRKLEAASETMVSDTLSVE